MTSRSEYESFLRSIGPFSLAATIRVVANLQYGFGSWLRGPETRVFWKDLILRHLLMAAPHASDSDTASDSALAPSVALAEELHQLQIATKPVCLEIADAMVTAGIRSLQCLKGSSIEQLKDRIGSVYSFSGLQYTWIFRHLQCGALNQIPAVSHADQDKQKVDVCYVVTPACLLTHFNMVLRWVKNAPVLLKIFLFQCRLQLKLIP